LIILGIFLSASAAAAQSRTPGARNITISDELPHLELAIGLTTMAGGPGRDAEREMRALHLDDVAAAFRRKAPPWTQPGIGWFGQVHVALSDHTMLGYIVSTAQQDTHGARTAPDNTPGLLVQSSYVNAHQDVKTRALIMSLRPNSWLKVGVGPAVHERTFELQGPQSTAVSVADGALGWVAHGQLILHREPMTYDHPPFLVTAIAQYRAAGAAIGDGKVISLGTSFKGTDLGNVDWPATPLHFSHWMVGLALGLEF
jgi:hypothetical protein